MPSSVRYKKNLLYFKAVLLPDSATVPAACNDNPALPDNPPYLTFLPCPVRTLGCLHVHRPAEVFITFRHLPRGVRGIIQNRVHGFRFKHFEEIQGVHVVIRIVRWIKIICHGCNFRSVRKRIYYLPKSMLLYQLANRFNRKSPAVRHAPFPCNLHFLLLSSMSMSLYIHHYTMTHHESKSWIFHTNRTAFFEYRIIFTEKRYWIYVATKK